MKTKVLFVTFVTGRIMFRPDASGATFTTPSQRCRVDPAPGPSSPAEPWRASRLQRGAKRTADIVLSAALLIVLAPLLLAIAWCVACSSGFPVIYRQRRIGRGGQPFTFFKFRSMSRDADRVLQQHLRANSAARTEWGDFQNLHADPRVTRLGVILRRLSLDELPQLWNVLRGDMSLVGPRPCMERQMSLHAEGWTHYCAMRPGMSGLWQVSGRNRLTYRERVALDIEYVERWSLGLDLLILARTLRAVLAGGG